MERIVRQFLIDHPGISSGDTLVVGVSGGPDSMSLAHILSRLDYHTVIAHLDHGMREESKTEVRFVRNFAERIGVEFRSAEKDVPEIAKRQGQSLEEAARDQRYEFLFRTAEEEGGKAILVGHTADDQVETVLMHFLRGAGLSGIRGMQPSGKLDQFNSDIYLLRPLLSSWRKEVLEYCHANSIETIFDRSNLDQTIFRNRIRHELIPNLETYNPKIRQGIFRMAGIVAEDNAVLEADVSAVWRDCVREANEQGIRFDLQVFLELPLGIRRRLIRRALGLLRPHLKDFDFQTVEKAIDFVENPTVSRESDLAANLRILLRKDSFWIAPWGKPLHYVELPRWEGGERELKFPCEIALGSGWLVRMKIEPWKEELKREVVTNEDVYSGWFDGDAIGGSIFLRNPQKGDRFQPLGMGGKSMKLADFFINVKIPRSARDTWPLFCTKNEILWVPGYRQNESTKLTDNTKTVLHIKLLMQ